MNKEDNGTMKNKLIKELAERAGFDYEQSAFNINKFAELLMNECGRACSDSMCSREYSASDLIEFWFDGDNEEYKHRK